MGHHYVPQRYLRGFQCPEKPGWVWAFDKQSEAVKQLPIKQVAQAPDFYELDVERTLNMSVEIPGGAAIEKVCRGAEIDEDERQALTYYIGTML